MSEKIPPSAEAKQKSFNRTGTALLLTAAFLASAAVPGEIGAVARGLGTAVSDTAGMVYMMHKGEEMYLPQAILTDPHSNTWRVTGLPFSNADYNKEGFKFTVKETALNDAWARAQGHRFFVSDFATAPINPLDENARYTVTYYRPLSSLFKSGPKEAVLLDVKPLPPEPPKTAHSGVPVSLPPGVWNRAFFPF